MHARPLSFFLQFAVSAAHAQFGPAHALTELHTNNHAHRAALFDADGDNDLDMVLATRRMLTLRRNDGTGLFTMYEIIHHQQCDPLDLAWGDLDADGDLDLVQAASAPDSALIWLSNDGDGHFLLEQVLATSGSGRQDLSLADLDDDSDPDIFLDGHIFRNNGSGVFSAAQNVGADAEVGIPADVDLDGDLDLIGIDTDFNRLGYYPDTGASYGTWQLIGPVTWEIEQLLVVDLEQDGDSDVVVVSLDQIELYIQLDSGEFAPAVLLTENASDLVKLRAGDVSSDGIPDLVALDEDRRLLVFVNNGDASFAPVNTLTPPDESFNASDLQLADVDADGLLDAIAVRLSSVHCDMGDGAGSFGGTRVVLPEMYYGASTGDMDGDGDLDILLSTAWLEQASPGNFTVMRTIYVGAPRQSAADFTGDGLMDTYTSREDYQETDSIAWFHNLGGGQFERIPLGATWPNTWDAQAWDLDADGDLDLLRAANESGVGVVYDHRNDGAGHLLPAAYSLSGGNDQVRSVAVADFDGDGDPDVACHQNWGPFSVYENIAATSLVESPVHEVMPTGHVDFAYAGDMDTDGDADLLFTVDENMYWYANNGLGNSWTPHTIATNVDEDRDPADLGDIDADGDPDVIYRTGGNEVSYRMNDGTGLFGPPILLMDPQWNVELDLVDLDSDGDADLILQYDQVVQVFMNTTVDNPTALQLPGNEERPILRPNPFEEAATLELGTPLTPTDHVRILDISGRVLRTIRGTGRRILPIERGQLNAGVYVLQVIFRDRSSSMRMVVR